MSSYDYVITTLKGCIPYLLDSELKKPLKVFLDDIIYKDSFYDKNNSMPLKKFIGTETEVVVGFRNKPSILTSKQGNYKLKKEKNNEVIKLLDCKNIADYDTGKLTFNDREVRECSIDEINNISDVNKDGCVVFGTEFINEFTNKGMLLIIENESGKFSLRTKHINESEFTYQKYMYSINEINTFTFISESNLKTFDLFIKKLNEKDLNEKDLNEKDLNQKESNEKDLNQKDLDKKDLN